MQANKRRHPKAKPRKRFWSFIRKLVLWCLVMAAIGAAVGYFGFMMAWKRYDNWAAEFDLERINDLEKPSIIYDRNGEEIGRIYVENRSYVTLDKISPAMINALIAQEDSRFREHPGYDFLGILRAGREYIHNSGDANQGASSITQQLARNAYDLKNRAKARNEGSFGRKFVEIALARRITEGSGILPEPRLLWQRVLRHPGRFPGLLRQRAGGSDHPGGRLHRRPDQKPERTFPSE